MEIRYRPSDMMELVQNKNSSERELVLAGYGSSRADPEDKFVADEYNIPNDEGDIFVAYKRGRAIGSITVVNWNNEHPLGALFWEQLHRTAPEMIDRIEEETPIAIDIAGIVIHPDERGKHIGRELYKKALNYSNPQIVLGQTQNPDAVMLRRTILDFRTFYACTEVTPDNPQVETTIHEPIVLAYLTAFNRNATREHGYSYQEEIGLTPSIPNTVLYPRIIQVAFAPVVDAQRKVTRGTVVAPHISVKRTLLPTRM